MFFCGIGNSYFKMCLKYFIRQTSPIDILKIQIVEPLIMLMMGDPKDSIDSQQHTCFSVFLLKLRM